MSVEATSPLAVVILTNRALTRTLVHQMVGATFYDWLEQTLMTDAMSRIGCRAIRITGGFPFMTAPGLPFPSVTYMCTFDDVQSAVEAKLTWDGQ